MIHSAPKAVRDILGEDYSLCESPSLRLEKIARIPEKGENKEEKERENQIKKEEVRAVIARVNKLAENRTFADYLPPLPPGAKEIRAPLGGRLIVDPSGSLIEHAGIKLHPHFGMPFVPGSSVKGVARHAAWCAWRDAKEADRPTIAERIAEVFGYPTGDKDLDDDLAARSWKGKMTAGTVVFFPAYPTGYAPLAMDIVNVHHREYYLRTTDGENGHLLHPVALDDEQPLPNFFPAVEKGAEFRFAIAPTARATEDDMTFAKEALVSAITLHGVGAKTAAGYGWFDYDTTDYASLEPDEAKLKKWEAAFPTPTQQKKKFLNKLLEIVDCEHDLPLMRTAVAFIVTKSWWPDEKKNAGSKITMFVKKWDEKFKLGVF